VLGYVFVMQNQENSSTTGLLFGVCYIMERSKGSTGQRGEPSPDPRDCPHKDLAKVESDINDVDTDVLLYLCTTCRKPFTITEY
jgi:hypothetical protein